MSIEKQDSLLQNVATKTPHFSEGMQGMGFSTFIPRAYSSNSQLLVPYNGISFDHFFCQYSFITSRAGSFSPLKNLILAPPPVDT